MPARKFGYACQNLTLNEGKKPKDRILTDRTLRMDGFSLERVGELAVKNTNDLVTIVKWNSELRPAMRFFRIGSGIFPFMDHPKLGYSLDSLAPHHSEAIIANMAEAGRIARESGVRLSCHPGPYTCIASPNAETVAKSVQSLQMHSLMGDLLGCGQEFAINIHMGGVYGSKDETAERFVANFAALPPQIRNRLTVENDDKASMWSMSDLYEKVASRCPVKLVLDIHHHRFCQRESLEDAAQMAFSTWRGFCEVPKVHYSESREGSRPQAHSDYIKRNIPTLCKTQEYDVMIEAKAKDLAMVQYFWIIESLSVYT
jgi:UV DNA damage endonuclease